MEIYIMYAGLFWNREWRYISYWLAYFGTENGVIYHVGWLILEQRMEIYIMYAGLFWNREWSHISCGWPILEQRIEIYIM